MGPEELKRKMEEGADQASKTEALMDRAGAILSLYQKMTKAFIERPKDFDAKFDAGTLSLGNGWQQEKYFRQVMKTFLRASIEAVQTAEKFHLSQAILAHKKSGGRGEVKIEGVILPEIGKSSADLEAECECGHNFGNHTGQEDGFCMDLTCECNHFKPTKEGSEDD